MHLDIFHVFTASTQVGLISLQDKAKLQKENGGTGYFFLLQALNVTKPYPSDSLYCMEATISRFLHAKLKLCLTC